MTEAVWEATVLPNVMNHLVRARELNGSFCSKLIGFDIGLVANEAGRHHSKMDDTFQCLGCHCGIVSLQMYRLCCSPDPRKWLAAKEEE